VTRNAKPSENFPNWAARDTKKLRRTLKDSGQEESEAIMHRFEENVILLERGRLVLPMAAT